MRGGLAGNFLQGVAFEEVGKFRKWLPLTTRTFWWSAVYFPPAS